MTALAAANVGTEQPELSLHPEAGAWRRLLDEHVARRPPEAMEFRRELGLPADRPVILTGHQAQIWHPGILSKWFCAMELARLAGAVARWVVVDQDTHGPGVVRLPVRCSAGRFNGSRGGVFRVEAWSLGDGLGDRIEGEVPTGRQPPLRAPTLPVLGAGETWAAPGVGGGIEAIAAALARHQAAESCAAQVASAVGDLLGRFTQAMPWRPLMALAISRTRLFQAVVEGLQADPLACIRAYNAAVRAHPGERIQPLGEGEVPLWVIGSAAGSPRRRATVHDLGRPAWELAPRALLMTGLLRWAGCDLFVHGTGGGGAPGGRTGYDRITEQWLSEWRGGGVGISPLAPSVVATATVRLKMDHAGPGAAERRRAQWLAHRAAHDPGVLGDGPAGAQKRAMVERIAELKRLGRDARAEYRAMHALLGRVRASRSSELDRLKREAAAAATGLADAEIASDRTWAFPLYEPWQIERLADAVARAFVAGS